MAASRNEPRSAPLSTRNSSAEFVVNWKQKVGTYIVDSTIGNGNFSIVKLATHTITQMKVAIKVIDKSKLSAINLRGIYREVEIMKKLKHPNIIQLYQIMETEKILYIVMEYAPKGELFDLIASKGRLKEIDAREKMMQIVSALEYCHQHGIVHRDIKCENILFDEDGNIKIIDFGFGNTFDLQQVAGEQYLMSTFCGSPPYAAPEIFLGIAYDGRKADVWSLGVLLYVLVCGCLPFDAPTLKLLKEQVISARFRTPYWLSYDCEHVLRRMLMKDPQKRPFMDKLKNFAWFKSLKPSSAGSSDHSSASDNEASVSSVKETLSSSHGYLHNLALNILERSGMPRIKVLNSLHSEAYDHIMAVYLLLMRKLQTSSASKSSSNLTLLEMEHQQQLRRRHSSVVPTSSASSLIPPTAISPIYEEEKPPLAFPASLSPSGSAQAPGTAEQNKMGPSLLLETQPRRRSTALTASPASTSSGEWLRECFQEVLSLSQSVAEAEKMSSTVCDPQVQHHTCMHLQKSVLSANLFQEENCSTTTTSTTPSTPQPPLSEDVDDANLPSSRVYLKRREMCGDEMSGYSQRSSVSGDSGLAYGSEDGSSRRQSSARSSVSCASSGGSMPWRMSIPLPHLSSKLSDHPSIDEGLELETDELHSSLDSQDMYADRGSSSSASPPVPVPVAAQQQERHPGSVTKRRPPPLRTFLGRRSLVGPTYRVPPAITEATSPLQEASPKVMAEVVTQASSDQLQVPNLSAKEVRRNSTSTCVSMRSSLLVENVSGGDEQVSDPLKGGTGAGSQLVASGAVGPATGSNPSHASDADCVSSALLLLGGRKLCDAGRAKGMYFDADESPE